MMINTNTIVSATEANQNFSRVTRIADANGQAVIFKNNKPKYLLIDMESTPYFELTDDEKIDIIAKRVLSKADEDIHAKFLLRNGADAIIYPEKHIAERIAIEEASDSIFECVELGSGYYIMEISPRKEWLGKSIRDLKFRNTYHLNIMAVKRDNAIKMMPEQDYVFCKEEHILVLGKEMNLFKAAGK